MRAIARRTARRSPGLSVALTLAAALALLAPGSAAAQTQVSQHALSPAEIVADAVRLDGMSVVLEGEAIGDRLHGDAGHVWLNVLGDGKAIGVFVDSTAADAVEHLGSFSHTGDIVRAEGIVNAACDRHGGDLDVHASSLEVVAAGQPVEHDVDVGFGIAGAIAIAIAAVLTRVHRSMRLRAGERR